MVARILIAASLVLGIPACGEELNPQKILEERLREIANPGAPPLDNSNASIGNAAAIALGKKFYFDTDFSGYATTENILQVSGSMGRAARGERIRIACVTCHDLDRAGTDPGDGFPNHVSIGAGTYDVNAQPTVNAAYNKLVYWNGRNDSLWSQILSVVESRVSMFGSRLRVVWRIADAYRNDYNAAFPDDPLPAEFDSIALQIARLEADGSCTLNPDTTCPTPNCHEFPDSQGVMHCLPRFPLEARPGFKVPGELWSCDWGTTDPLQPYSDAYDCMDLGDRAAVIRIYVNFAKAIAAYEYTLVQVDSPFDRWVTSDFKSDDISESAQRGARLFVGKAACAGCHDGPMMSDDLLHNVGVPQDGEGVPTLANCPQGAYCDCVTNDNFVAQFCFPKGARDGLRLLQENGFRRDSAYSDDPSCSNKRALHKDRTHAEENPEECDGLVGWYPIPVDQDTVGAWRTPGLRNVAVTGPYMHNGMYDTLAQVVEHYDTAASEFLADIVGPLDADILELFLTDQEKADLVAFMEALTGAPLEDSIRTAPTIPPDSPFPNAAPF